jgi:hypothetical protein
VTPTGWSEPIATGAPVQDEVVQTVLGMNQKHILFPCPGIFQPPSLPQKFPLLPTSLPPLLPPSPHFPFIPSPELGRAPELRSHRALKRHETQGLRKVENSMLKECGEEKTRGVFHPKCRSERRKVNSFLSLHFFFSMVFFFLCV